MKKNHIQGMVPHMNKIEAFVTNIQKQVIDAMGYVGGCSSRLIRIDGEFDPQEAIRAYLTALPSSPVSELVERLDTCAVATFPIVQEAATALTDLEAENARLRDRLAEAMKALDPFALVAKHDIGESEADDDLFRPMERHNRAPRLMVGNLRAARRVREGGKVDG